ncbi:hypothetical protein [Stieleria varia]|uniref:Uncharacterized protein n=1 Tax=Stieleria varia TaxID=2528005 RepID=A0A5C6AQH9_9BACT|nr:hypothetical protein [Stieleria varia]TWU02303.1 hypothetical protein Pla52n_33530 [Stieleria varia]
MNRWLWIGSLAGLLLCSTGCLRHNTRGGCSSCGTPACSTGGCQTGSCGSGSCGGDCNSGSCGGAGGGLLGKLRGNACGCNGGCRTGCVPGPMGWQQGGLDYSSHLNPGMCGHQAQSSMNSVPFQAGPPTGQVAYPYYTVRGPRDFFVDNPPTIGR